MTQFHIEFGSARDEIDVFISYASCHSDLVSELLKTLSTESTDSENVVFFRDVDSLRSGELWDRAIMDAIFRSRVLVSVISSEYCASPYCMLELLLFLNRDIIISAAGKSVDADVYSPGGSFGRTPIVPLRVKDCTLPAPISRIHAPLIPECRPFPDSFVGELEAEIKIAISRSCARRPLGKGMISGSVVGPDRDWLGIQNPIFAQSQVKRLAECCLSQTRLAPEVRSALESIVQSATFG